MLMMRGPEVACENNNCITLIHLSDYAAFTEGNQVKVDVPVSDEANYLFQRGVRVEIHFNEEQMNGVIVSNPITIYPVANEQKAISVRIEKS